MFHSLGRACVGDTRDIKQSFAYFLLSATVWVRSAGCPPDWYGPSCKYKCHCLQGAEDCVEGVCAHGCKEDYFGATCQYMKLPLMPLAQAYFQSSLHDHNRTTCLERNAEPYISFALVYPTALLNIECIFKEDLPSVYPEIYLMTIGEHGEHGLVRCPVTEHNYVASGNGVIITCSSTLVTQFLSFAGPSVQDLCEISVSPGTNIALGSNLTMTNMGARQPVVVKKQSLVDGSRASCLNVPVGGEILWRLTFANPMDINLILIYGHVGRGHNTWHSATVTILSHNGERLYESESINQDLIVNHIRASRPEQNITASHIEIRGGWSVICEIEYYGAPSPACTYQKCLDTSACQSGSYGPDCGQMCSTNCLPSPIPVCNPINGDCLVCPPNTYGATCENACNSNCNDSACNYNTGVCLSGCEGHFVPPECTVCLPGFYGSGCEKICNSNCLDGACDNETGSCLTGCEGHFTMPECTVCLPEFYGSECEMACSSNCVDGACDNETGLCLTGCEGHFTMPECTVCPPEFYGSGCEKVCNSNCRNGTCARDTGLCLSGCEGHFNPPECTEDRAESAKHQEATSLFIATTLLVVVGILMILALVQVCVIEHRRFQLIGSSYLYEQGSSGLSYPLEEGSSIESTTRSTDFKSSSTEPSHSADSSSGGKYSNDGYFGPTTWV